MKYGVAFALLALITVSALPTTLFADEPVNFDVSLTDSSRRHLCDAPGILLTPSSAIFPAHCVHGMPVSSLNVVAGEGQAEQQRIVSLAVVHENWNAISPELNNVAVVEFPPMEISSLVQAVSPETQSDLDQALQMTTRYSEYFVYSEWIYTKITGDDGGGMPPMICP